MEKKMKYIAVELAHHLPYSVSGITMAILMMGILTFFTIIMRAGDLFGHASEELFHVFHPAHRFTLGVDETGSVGMQVHDLGIHQLFGHKFFINRVDNLGGHRTAGISQGQINGRHHWKTAAGIG